MTTIFHVMRFHPKLEPLGVRLESFNNPQAAETYAMHHRKELENYVRLHPRDSTYANYKVRLVPEKHLNNTLEWHAREAVRMFDGTYKCVPWHGQSWIIKEHFAHFSTENNMQVAFTPDDAHGEANRKVRMKVGRYLDRFYNDVLPVSARRQWEDTYIDSFVEPELLLAKTENEIEMVYTDGPNSCMSGPVEKHVTDGYHPVRVYAAGDLAVAYIKNNRGRISARCVCWPEKKIFGRRYGDTVRLLKALRSAGYQDGPYADFRSSLAGARILLRKRAGGTQYVRPYFDAPAQGLRVKGEYLELFLS